MWQAWLGRAGPGSMLARSQAAAGCYRLPAEPFLLQSILAREVRRPPPPPPPAPVYNRLIAAMGRPDMGIDNPRFATDALRCQNEKEILEVWHPCQGAEVGMHRACLSSGSSPAPGVCTSAPAGLPAACLSTLQPAPRAYLFKCAYWSVIAAQVIEAWVGSHTSEEVMAAMNEARVRAKGGHRGRGAGEGRGGGHRGGSTRGGHTSCGAPED